MVVPSWIEGANGAFVVDPDTAYPAIITQLVAVGIKREEAQLDQYWVECCHQIAKLAVHEVFAKTEHDPRGTGKGGFTIYINSGGGRKDRWALKNYPTGRGIKPATNGREARAHFDRIRKALLA